MKKRNSIYIVLSVMLATSLACSFGNAANPTATPEQEPTATTLSEQISPTSTITVSQDNNNDDGDPGPETIDLSNPALYITSSAPAYKFDVSMQFAGVDTAGSEKNVSLLMTSDIQTVPQKAQRFLAEVIGGEGSAESVILGEQGYSVFLGACYPFETSSLDGQNPADEMPRLQDDITGQAQLVESGIAVNGFITDKYELTQENVVADDELINAFVYVARDGGFITLFELQGRTKTDYQGLSPDQLTEITITHNYIPVEDGSLDIAIPAVCGN